MKKAVLGDKIYLTTDKDLEDKIQKELTYKFFGYTNIGRQQIETEKLYSKFKEDVYIIPIGRQDLIPEDYEVVDKRVTVPIKFPKFNATLRGSQQKIYDEVDDNCMINAPPSWGKTFTLLAIAQKLGQKTIVCVTTKNLLEQWIEEVRKVFNMEPGVITSGRFQISSPIVIGNIQSVIKTHENIRKEFGLLVIDEMHHVSAPTFRTLLQGSYARYKIGLSGTLKRKDERHVIFKDLYGPKVFKPSRENFMTPSVIALKSGLKMPMGSNWAKKMSALCSVPEYQRITVAAARKYAQEGHKVLVISDRVGFLTLCAKMTDNSVCITGSTPDRKKLMIDVNEGDTSILFGSRSIFSEGVSLNSLSCLILATPINNEPMLEQLIGRIIRIKENKLPPLVVDIVLECTTGRRQWANRLSYYLKQNYKVQYL